MGEDARTILVDYVAPIVGVVVSNLMYGSPLLAALEVRKSGEIGSLNPLPYPVIFANCLGWTVYAMLKHDWFVYLGSVSGIAMGLLFITSTLPHTPSKLRTRIELLLAVLTAEICVLAAVTGLCGMTYEERSFAWGLNCNAILLLFYASPLSVIYRVLKHRSSAELYWPISATSLLNASMWAVYGLYGRQDVWIWLPNGIGVVLAAIQLFLWLVFPSKAQAMQHPGDGDEEYSPLNNGPANS